MSWTDWLTSEGLSLTCQIEIHWQNRGINEVRMDGKPLRLTKESRASLKYLVEEYIVYYEGGDGGIIDHDDLSLPTKRNVRKVTLINLHSGVPSGTKVTEEFIRYLRRESPPQEGDFGFTAE